MAATKCFRETPLDRLKSIGAEPRLGLLLDQPIMNIQKLFADGYLRRIR
jgi:hypothetical protein